MSRQDRIRGDESERPGGGSIMTIDTTRPIGRIALAFACLAAVAGCATVDVWRRPLTTPEAPQPWPRPDRPGELDVEEIRTQLLDLHNRARKEKGRSSEVI